MKMSANQNPISLIELVESMLAVHSRIATLSAPTSRPRVSGDHAAVPSYSVQ